MISTAVASLHGFDQKAWLMSHSFNFILALVLQNIIGLCLSNLYPRSKHPLCCGTLTLYLGQYGYPENTQL